MTVQVHVYVNILLTLDVAERQMKENQSYEESYNTTAVMSAKTAAGRSTEMALQTTNSKDVSF